MRLAGVLCALFFLGLLNSAEAVTLPDYENEAVPAPRGAQEMCEGRAGSFITFLKEGEQGEGGYMVLEISLPGGTEIISYHLFREGEYFFARDDNGTREITQGEWYVILRKGSEVMFEFVTRGITDCRKALPLPPVAPDSFNIRFPRCETKNIPHIISSFYFKNPHPYEAVRLEFPDYIARIFADHYTQNAESSTLIMLSSTNSGGSVAMMAVWPPEEALYSAFYVWQRVGDGYAWVLYDSEDEWREMFNLLFAREERNAIPKLSECEYDIY